jgi:uncharacterized protein (TIGR03067 family)
MIRSVFLLLCLVAAEKDDASKKDMDAMQGDWAAERMVRDGFAFPDDDAQAIFRTVKGDAYTMFRFRKKIGAGTFKLDATKTPKQIDATPTGGAKGMVVRGIYKIEKGVLTICFAMPGKDRPTAFEAKEGSGHTLTVWKKEKK